MKLQVYCKSCQEPFEIKSSANDRAELENEIGAYFTGSCPHCGTNKEYHVNNVVASPSDITKFGGFALGGLMIVGGTIATLKIGYITSIGIAIGGLIIYYTSGKAPNSVVNLFNSYKIRKSKRN